MALIPTRRRHLDERRWLLDVRAGKLPSPALQALAGHALTLGKLAKRPAGAVQRIQRS